MPVADNNLESASPRRETRSRPRRASSLTLPNEWSAMISAYFMTHISRSPSGHGHTERIAPRWCRLAPHTRASACTRACTLYGCAARAPHGNDESSTLEHLASGPLSLSPPLSRTRASSRFLADSPRVARRALALRRAAAESRVPDRRTLLAVRARACECARACTRRAVVCVRT